MAVKMAGYLQNESQDCACRKERGVSFFPFTETGTKPNSSLCYMVIKSEVTEMKLTAKL